MPVNDGLLFPIACYESVFYLKKKNQAHSISFFTVLCFCSSIKAHSHLSSAPVKKTRKACGQQDKSIESKTLKKPSNIAIKNNWTLQNFLTSPSASIFMPEKCNLLNSLCCIDCINCTILTKILTQRPSQLPGKNAQSTRQTVKFAPFVMLVTFPSSTCGDCGRSAVSYKHSGVVVVLFFFSFFVRSSIM